MSERGGKARSRTRAAGLARKVLVPVVATTVSALASYAAKKAPEVLEAKVMPKLRELRDTRAAGGVPAQAKSALSGAGNLAEGLTERVRSVGGGESKRSSERPSLSREQRERQRSERAQRREARREALRSS